MGVYRIRLKKSAAKEIDRLPDRQDRRRIVDCIEALAANPRPQGCEKLAGQTNRYRIRQGRYRIVYSIEDTILTVFIIRVADRKDVYR